MQLLVHTLDLMFKIFKLILVLFLIPFTAIGAPFGGMPFSFWKYAPTLYYAGSFDGTSTSNLTVPSFTMSYAGDFTVECWFKTTTSTTYASIYSDEASGTGGTILLNNGSNNGQITVYIGTVINNFNSNSYTNLNDGNWHYVALSRTGSSLYLFIDGNLANSTTASGTLAGNSTFRIGDSPFTPRYFNGLISNFRVNFSGLYTSNFSVPRSPLTAIANTQLLTCESSTFIDLSSNAYSINNSGSATISSSTTYP